MTSGSSAAGSRRHGGAWAIAVGALVVLSVLPASARAGIYWANGSSGTIARAGLDGSGVDGSFVTGASSPSGVAVGGGQIMWSHEPTTGSIGRMPLSGPVPDHAFISTAGLPLGVGFDGSAIYWTQTADGSGSVGRAQPDGSSVSQTFKATSSAGPCGVASDAHEVFWANTGSPGPIEAAHGVFSPPVVRVSATDDPCGVVRAGAHIYWTNRGSDSIGRALVDGSAADAEFISLSALSAPCGVAVADGHIYWTSAANAIGRADLDGSDVVEDFITGTSVQGACGIAAGPTLGASPDAVSFGSVPAGSLSSIALVTVANTSSSPLSIAAVAVAGSAASEFRITGQSCLSPVPPGGACFVNLRFAPSGVGPRVATLDIASDSATGPVVVPLSGEGVVPPDRVRPRIVAARIVPRAFRVRRARAAALFRIRVSERARLRLVFQRRRAGRWRRAGAIRRRARPGLNRIRFSGRVGRRFLRAGRYRGRIAAVDPAGNVSRPRFVRFRVLG